MRSILVLTFDIEKENFLEKGKNTHGVEEGLPLLIDFLISNNLPATFFVSANLCETFPDLIQESGKKFEIASHGFHHERFSEITDHHVEVLETSKKLLEDTTHQKVLGFRAPFLSTCPKLFDVLYELGFKYDSSLPLFRKETSQLVLEQLKEFPPFFSNALIRFPRGFKKLKLAVPPDREAVLYFHPWEFVNMKKFVSIRDFFFRPDRWLNTGKKFLSIFNRIITYFQDENFHFFRLDQLL